MGNGILGNAQSFKGTNIVVTAMQYRQAGYINGLVQDCSISIANTLEILQSCTKPLM